METLSIQKKATIKKYAQKKSVFGHFQGRKIFQSLLQSEMHIAVILLSTKQY